MAQPFLLNAWTKVPANWLAPTERATGVALVTLANLVGIAIGEALTPTLIGSLSVGFVQVVYGVVALLSAAAFVLLVPGRPPHDVVEVVGAHRLLSRTRPPW